MSTGKRAGRHAVAKTTLATTTFLFVFSFPFSRVTWAQAGISRPEQDDGFRSVEEARSIAAPVPDEGAWVRTLATKIASHGHCTLLMDGLPAEIPSLPSGLTERIEAAGSDTSAAVTALGEALDCDVCEGRGVFYLTHRYRRAPALPGISLEEGAAFLRDLEGILRRFNALKQSEKTRRLEGATVYSILDSYWWMRRDEGLPVKRTGPVQQKLLGSFGGFNGYTSQQKIEALRVVMEAVAGEEARFTAQVINGRKVYGVECPFRYRPLFFPLSDPDFTRRDSDGMLRTLVSITSETGEDLTKPGLVATAMPPVARETVATVMARRTQASGQALHLSGQEEAVVVEPALAGKPLEVFGAERLSLRALAEAVGKLYNLRIARSPDSDTRVILRRHSRAILPNVDSLAGEVRRIAPSPLVRYGAAHGFSTNSDEVAAWMEVRAKRPAALDPASQGTDIQERSEPPFPIWPPNHPTPYLNREVERRAAAVLRAYAASLDANGKLAANPLPVSRLSPPMRSAIANFFLAELVNYLPSLLSNPPDRLRMRQ